MVKHCRLTAVNSSPTNTRSDDWPWRAIPTACLLAVNSYWTVFMRTGRFNQMRRVTPTALLDRALQYRSVEICNPCQHGRCLWRGADEHSQTLLLQPTSANKSPVNQGPLLPRPGPSAGPWASLTLTALGPRTKHGWLIIFFLGGGAGGGGGGGVQTEPTKTDWASLKKCAGAVHCLNLYEKAPNIQLMGGSKVDQLV